MPPQTQGRSNGELADRVKSILRSKKLTLYQASQRSATLFGRSSLYYLPHNLYYDLRHGSFSPSLFQLFAFSWISNYRLTDWLGVFGFDVELIPRLQIELPSRRTALLDSSLADPNVLIPWLRNLGHNTPPAGAVVPLSQILEWTTPRRIGPPAELKDNGFLYAKIGYQDALAFPELLPGSIVRANSRIADALLKQINAEGSPNLFLIEHAKGLCCCHLRAVGIGGIAVSSQMPYAQVEFKVPQEARLVGVVDLEIRNLRSPEQPTIAKELTKRWKPEVLSPEPSQLGSLLRHARLRMGLSFRAASAISREVANLLGDERYFIAPGSLSDYETLNTPPRHFHKIITFCAVYSLRLNVIFETLGLSLQGAGHEPMPDALMGRGLPMAIGTVADMDKVDRTGFIGELVAELGEIPFFLRGSLKALCGLSSPSLKDFFWIGGTRNTFHPYLAGGLLAIVYRQKKKPNDCGAKPLWQQPLYVILKRDGTYAGGCCSRENNSLVVHSYPGGVHRREQFRNRDAEVIGKIVTIVRRLI